MLEQIEIEPTYRSPGVNFDPQNAAFKIHGNSILVNVEEFYHPLLNWMSKFIKETTTTKVKFVFDIHNTNVASTKRILFFLFKLKDLKSRGVEVDIEWFYPTSDSYVLEVGEDFSQMCEMEFNFMGYEKLVQKQTILN